MPCTGCHFWLGLPSPTDRTICEPASCRSRGLTYSSLSHCCVSDRSKAKLSSTKLSPHGTPQRSGGKQSPQFNLDKPDREQFTDLILQPGDPAPKVSAPSGSTATSGDNTGMGVGLYAIILIGVGLAYGVLRFRHGQRATIGGKSKVCLRFDIYKDKLKTYISLCET